jgi:hypothetical protein
MMQMRRRAGNASRLLLSKVPAEEHAPAFLGLDVVGDQAKTPLTLERS